MDIRSKFKGKNTKKCILKAVLKKNATVVVKLCPKNYLFCIPTIFLPQLFDIFTQIYLPYLWHFATLVPPLENVDHKSGPMFICTWAPSKRGQQEADNVSPLGNSHVTFLYSFLPFWYVFSEHVLWIRMALFCML